MAFNSEESRWNTVLDHEELLTDLIHRVEALERRINLVGLLLPPPPPPPPPISPLPSSPSPPPAPSEEEKLENVFEPRPPPPTYQESQRTLFEPRVSIYNSFCAFIEFSVVLPV